MILEYRGIGPVSKAIKLFAWLRFWTASSSRYSHTSWSDATVKDGKLIGDLSEYEAWYRGGVRHVEYIGKDHVQNTRVDLFTLKKPLTLKERDEGHKFLIAQIGKKYDWLGIFGMLFRVRSHRDNRWFCSELIFEFLAMSGRRIFNCIEAYQVPPGLIPTSSEVEYVGYIIIGEQGFPVHQDESLLVNAIKC